MWRVNEQDLENLAVGAGILGAGGGGNPYRGKLHARTHLRAGACIEVVSPEEVPDEALGVEVGNMGAPVIGMERLPRGDEAVVALRRLEAELGRSVTHLMPCEIGGSNSTLPLVVAAQTGLPVVDGDGMGRAFPELQQSTFMIAGASVSPAVLCDYRHTCVVLSEVESPQRLEKLARAVTVAMGGAASFAMTPMEGRFMRSHCIPHTLSLACRLGQEVRDARRSHGQPVEAACRVSGGRVLFRGRVVDVERRLQGGFARGRLRLEGNEESLEIDFQNENLIAWSQGRVLACVPDLICLVDVETAEPVTTEVVRFGLRVAVLGIPAPEALKQPEALAILGPRAFGYAVGYQPLPGCYGG